MAEYFYQGQPLSTYSLWELGQFLKSFIDAEKKREEASKHEKLKKRNIKLPPLNPEYLKLKSAIDDEIKFRQGLKNA
jgi:hypothetical protein